MKVQETNAKKPAKAADKSAIKKQTKDKPFLKKKAANGSSDDSKVKVNVNKYTNLTNKRKLNDDSNEVEPKKQRISNENGSAAESKNFKPKKFSDKNKPGFKKPFKNGAVKNGTSKSSAPTDKDGNLIKKKDLKKQRRQKKLAENYDVATNMKKIWETLRRSETTEETKKKLCSSLYENVKGKIFTMSMAHDTCRVIECLIQYGNDKHRAGVFEELKDNLIELSKSKYARFMIKKLLNYGQKEHKDHIIRAFSGHFTKLIKHSFACQVVETIYNEYANYLQRNEIMLEFYDSALAILGKNQKYKNLKEVLEKHPDMKEKILNNLKTILTSCIDKTLLMFSIIHRAFVEYFENCDQTQKAEMIDLLSEHLIHMIHTKDGVQVSMQCIWFGTAKDRKKIIKSLKSFILKIALEEQGHVLLLAIFDSVDDTKFISKSILEELFRSIKEVLANDNGRKVITYLFAPRDTRFFIKDYVKRLEAGDSKETSKKDPEKRIQELIDYSKKYVKDQISKELSSFFYNGPTGILMPVVLNKLEKDGDDIILKIADYLLETRYEPGEDSGKSKKEEGEGEEKKKLHPIEEATSHFLIKQLLALDQEREKKSLQTLTSALLSHKNSIYMTSWIQCNRGCFAIVKMIEVGSKLNQKAIKTLLGEFKKDLKKDEKNKGAKLLLEKINSL